MALLLYGGGYYAPDNRSQAKNIVKMIDLDYKETRLNGCHYTYDTTSCMDKTIVDTSTCKVDEVNVTMVWAQVVPDRFFGRELACMNQKVCTNVFTGEKFGSPLCCRRIDIKYKQMEAELFNLIPVVSSFVPRQEGKPFGAVEHLLSYVGEVKIGQSYIEPPERFKGDIARVYLYMDDRYGLSLSAAQRKMYEQWHKMDAVDTRECTMAKTITKIQKYPNRWIEAGCPK